MNTAEHPVTEAISASYCWNAAEFITAQRGHIRWHLGLAIVWLLNIFLSVLTLFSVFCLLVLRADTAIRIQLVLMGVGCFVLLIGREKLIDKWLGRHWKRSGSRGSEVLFQFTANAISIHGANASSIIKWKGFLKTTETRHGFLFYPQSRIFHWVPFTAFASQSDIEEVRDFIRQSGVPFTTSPG